MSSERIQFLHQLLAEQREQTEEGTANQIGITARRYERVLEGVEKILLDHAEDLAGDRPWPTICLWALDILGVDTEEDGWNPHRERAERMGW